MPSPSSLHRLACLKALAASLVLCGCAARTPPPRRVIERNFGSSWLYARYQKLLDVEIAIEGNPAEAHTAVYVNRQARFRGRVLPEDLAVAFVTEYRMARGLAMELAEQLGRLQGTYQVTVENLGGAFVHRLRRGAEAWVFWPSGNFVVKVGGPAREPPPRIVDAYLGRFPSDIGPDGLARAGTASAGVGAWVKKGPKRQAPVPQLRRTPGGAG